MLLKRDDVNPDKPDNCGRTPLSLAATPLSFAARDGHEKVVKMLLERDDPSPDKPDSDS